MLHSATTPESPLLDRLQHADFPKKDVCIAEALFGLHYVLPYLESLPDTASVLEVGCGSGILLGLLKERHPTLGCEGVEPFGDGFSAFQDLNHYIREQGVRIIPKRYEDHIPPAPYDVIYSVNVFEHLPDWRHFLSYVQQHLKPGGVCVILCPNYSFPYEAHFNLPVIINKSITGHIFKNRILRYEATQDSHGLWKSLNFVKLRQIRKTAQTNRLKLTVKPDIIEDMIARIDSDKEFGTRQKCIGALGKLARACRLTRLFRWKFFQDFLPYIYLELRQEQR